MKSENPSEIIKIIKRQFLCNVSLNNFKWHDVLKDLSSENQEILLNNTVNLDLVLKYPVNIRYQKSFIKYLIQSFEKQNAVIHDSVFEAYGRLVVLPSTFSYFKHYYLERNGNEHFISVKENINLISEGTTGLRTWQASLALSEWALQNEKFFNDKTILELGSGIGLTGLVISLHCSPKNFYFTDCHPSVLDTLCNNVKLNINNLLTSETVKVSDSLNSDTVKVTYSDRCLYEQDFNNSVVRVLDLPWEEVNSELCSELGSVNKVIAADIIYDSDLYPSLISAMDCLFSFCGLEEFIFACTERNKDTLGSFIKAIGDKLFHVEEVEVPKEKNFVWSTEAPVKIFNFKK